jgi:hypothetical protein
MPLADRQDQHCRPDAAADRVGQRAELKTERGQVRGAVPRVACDRPVEAVQDHGDHPERGSRGKLVLGREADAEQTAHHCR